MPRGPTFVSSSIGTKILIALTGLALFGFLVVHLIGNFLIFASAAAFNQYSHKLISNPLIYLAEAGLAAIFLLHVVKAFLNWQSNRRARPEGYARKGWAGHTSRKTWASTTMILSGTIIFVFVILHLITFKFGPGEAQGYVAASPGGPQRDMYRLVIEIFANPWYVLFYVACMGVIFLHLSHGVSSAMQSLGVNHPRYNRMILVTGSVLAVVIGAGFALIPVLVYVGVRP